MARDRVELWRQALKEEIELLDEHIAECQNERRLYVRMLAIADDHPRKRAKPSGRRKIPGSTLAPGRVWKTCEKCGLNQPAAAAQYKCRKVECKGPLRIWTEEDGAEKQSSRHGATS